MVEVLYESKMTLFMEGCDGDGGDCVTTVDCDCAPPPPPSPPSPPKDSNYLSLNYFQIVPGLIISRLTDSHYVIANPRQLPSVVVLSIKAFDVLSKFRFPISLEEFAEADKSDILSLVNSKLIVPFSEINYQPPERQDKKRLVSWLHTTNACSFGCKYCYIKKSSEKMTLEIGQKAIDLIFQEAVKHGFEGVKIKYAGGEASLNISLIMQLHKLARQKAAENKLLLEEILMTGGIISSSVREQVVSLGIRVMVSLDSLNDYHGIQRPLANGLPSGNIAHDTLEFMRAHGVDTFVSVTITKQDSKTLIELIDYLIGHEIPFSLSYVRDNDYFVEKENFQPTNKHLIETMKDVFNHLCENPPKQPLLGSLTDRASLSGPHDYTCAVGHNYLVIDHHGQISICQQEMQTPITTIYEPDPLLKVINNNIGIKNISVNEKEKCRVCEWKNWCTGGCAALTTKVYGRSDVQSPFCDVYKAILPEAVRLEGLRLLKYRFV